MGIGQACGRVNSLTMLKEKSADLSVRQRQVRGLMSKCLYLAVERSSSKSCGGGNHRPSGYKMIPIDESVEDTNSLWQDILHGKYV